MSHGNELLLPDSRCSSDVGSILVDRQLLDGSVVRQEFVPIFCASCGKEFSHKPIDGIPAGCVPKELVSFVCWLCPVCFEKHGEVAGTYSVPEDEFNQNVQAEMQAKFGRDLTGEEIAVLHSRGVLGSPLEKLLKESPYAAAMP